MGQRIERNLIFGCCYMYKLLLQTALIMPGATFLYPVSIQKRIFSDYYHLHPSWSRCFPTCHYCDYGRIGGLGKITTAAGRWMPRGKEVVNAIRGAQDKSSFCDILYYNNNNAVEESRLTPFVSPCTIVIDEGNTEEYKESVPQPLSISQRRRHLLFHIVRSIHTLPMFPVVFNAAEKEARGENFPTAFGGSLTPGNQRRKMSEKVIEVPAGSDDMEDEKVAAAAERMCQNGAIIDEESIPGAYQQACMLLPERKIILKTPPPGCGTLFIEQSPSTQTGGRGQNLSGRTGVVIWNSALLLTRLLDELAFVTRRTTAGNNASLVLRYKNKVRERVCEDNDIIELQRNGEATANCFNNKVVFEVGCGTGLTSITMAKLMESAGSKTNNRKGIGDNAVPIKSDVVTNCSSPDEKGVVYATDGNAEVLSLTRRNIEHNNVGRNAIPLSLPWGMISAIEYSDMADIIIGSDLTYNPGSWRSLAETVAVLLKPLPTGGTAIRDVSADGENVGKIATGGVFIYLSCGHSGFNLKSELDGFASVMESEGLVIMKESDDLWPWHYHCGRNVSSNSADVPISLFSLLSKIMKSEGVDERTANVIVVRKR